MYVSMNCFGACFLTSSECVEFDTSASMARTDESDNAREAKALP